MEEQRRKTADDPAPRPVTMVEGLLRHPLPPTATSATGPTSPQVEEVSLQQNKDKNKESLKRKLMLRRSVNELVDQGIYPPLKTPPAFAEQTRQLERAKTGDLLRHKIQHRPDREALVQQHILEDTRVDPSLQERQRQLKRARLQDSLSDRLANRPGPLELIERKILQADGELTDAIEEGKLQFPKSDLHCGTRPFLLEDDSNTSEGSPSPLAPTPTLHFGEGLEGMLGLAAAHNSIPSPPDISPLLAKMQASAPPGAKFVFSPGPLVSSPPHCHPTGVSSAPSTPLPTSSKNGSSGQSGSSSSKSSRSKKSKIKSTPKSKVIKFHEYKGPPSVVKSVASTLTPVLSPVSTNINTLAAIPPGAPSDTPYSVLLQQQQLFLQWQLEFQQKSLPVILPTVKSPMDDSIAHPLQSPTPPTPATTPVSVVAPSPNHQNLVLSPPAPSPVPVVQHTPPAPVKNTKLEDFKVADLKAELKKRNLPVSGPKPVLIERLKPFVAEALASLNAPRQPPQPSPSPSLAASQAATPCSAEASPAVSVSSLSSGLSSLSSLQGIGNIINIQPVTPQSVAGSDDTTMTSPPSSPLNDLTLSHHSFTSGPLSPGDMDMVPSPIVSVEQPILTSQLSTSHTPIPMMVDGQLSRPPSVAPMDVDLGLTSLPSALVVPVITSSSMQSLASSAPSMPQTFTLDSRSPPTTLPLDQKPELLSLAHCAPSVPMKVMSQEELLRAQQQQIEDLRHQLQQSQLQLAEAQSRALQQLQQQLQQQQALNAQPIKFTLTPAQVAALQGQVTLPQLAMNNKAKPKAASAAQHLPHPLQTQSLLTQIQQATCAPSSAASNMTSSVVDAVSLKNNLLNLVQAQALQQSIHLNGQKLVPMAPVAQHNGQPATSVIFTPVTTSTTAANNSSMKPRSNTVPNGLASIGGQTSSVPSSPVENSKLNRSASNPFFALRTLKDPPKYDEAMKHKQPVTTSSGPELSPISSTSSSQPPTLSPQQSPQHPSSSPSANSLAGMPLKSPTVDDVLEILIRSGEIIPGAVDQSYAKDGKPVSSSSVPISSSGLPLDSLPSLDAVATADNLCSLAAGYGNQGAMSTAVSSVQYSPNSFTSSPAMLANTYTQSGACNSPSPLGPSLGAGSSPTITMPKVSHPSHSPSPLNLTNALSTDFIDFPSNLSDLPFITMDWSDSDTNMNTLDLSDVLDGTPPHLDVKTEHDLAASSGTCSQMNPGSNMDPGLMYSSALNDGLDTNGAMNIDVSDWLDVIMPSTGLTPLSSNAPVSFSSDPILTPKPQEFLDLFNMEESDLYSTSDLGAPSSFDKALEAATSKS